MLKKIVKLFSSQETHLRTGDLVWMIEDKSPRDHYLLARVKSLNYGNDGIARSSVIRAATGEYTRPIVKLPRVLAPWGSLSGLARLSRLSEISRSSERLRLSEVFSSSLEITKISATSRPKVSIGPKKCLISRKWAFGRKMSNRPKMGIWPKRV